MRRFRLLPRVYRVRQRPDGLWGVYTDESEWAVSVQVTRVRAEEWVKKAVAEDLRRTGAK